MPNEVRSYKDDDTGVGGQTLSSCMPSSETPEIVRGVGGENLLGGEYAATPRSLLPPTGIVIPPEGPLVSSLIFRIFPLSFLT